ncbi:MAG: glycosyltransferase family 2 protein, partial [Candidatus Eisenbacteria bacterium]|nr:glycosyltransferase family 2 protein [Candidatus Eisenbacteria bacterium]
MITEHEGLSVVVPVHDEQDALPALCENLLATLAPLGRPFEILLVDDASRDASPEVARSLSRSEPRIRSLRLSPHAGQSGALAAGFRAARMPVIVTLDADLQNDPADIPRLLDALRDADAVCGIRAERRDTWVRRASSRIANRIRDGVTGDHVTDTGCGLKAFRAEFLREIKMYRGLHRFLPTLLRQEGARVVEIPVAHRRRTSGRSKYGIRNRALPALRDCFAVRWMRDRSLRYEVHEDAPPPPPGSPGPPGPAGPAGPGPVSYT